MDTAVQRLRNGRRIVGTMIRMIRNPAVAQIARQAGLDFVMLDLEHGPYSFETVADITKVARSVGLGIFARVPELARGYVSRVMDMGVEGVMVPMLSSAEQARDLVRWARYAPIGGRGLSSDGEFTEFGGIGPDVPRFMKQQNDATLAIAQIETTEAVENIDAIAQVNGIDVLLVGPNDLAVSLGVPGELMGERTQRAIGEVARAAREHEKLFAIHGSDELLALWRDDTRMIMSSLDIGMIKSQFHAIAERHGGE